MQPKQNLVLPSSLVAVGLLSTLLACSGSSATPPPPPDGCPVSLPTAPAGTTEVSRRLILLDHLTFAQEVVGGELEGMDLDCRVSDSHDDEGCRRADRISASGTPGIDNQLSRLLPSLTSIVGTDLVQTQLAASEGPTGLPVLSLTQLSDGTVDVSFVSASTLDGASVTRQADGSARAMQALRIDASHAQWLGRALPEGNTLTLRAGTLALPLQLPDDHAVVVPLIASTTQVGARLDLGDPRAGVLAGAITVDELMRITRLLGLGSYADVVQTIYTSSTDLDPDGMGGCANLSFGLVFEPVDVVEAP